MLVLGLMGGALVQAKVGSCYCPVLGHLVVATKLSTIVQGYLQLLTPYSGFEDTKSSYALN